MSIPDEKPQKQPLKVSIRNAFNRVAQLKPVDVKNAVVKGVKATGQAFVDIAVAFRTFSGKDWKNCARETGRDFKKTPIRETSLLLLSTFVPYPGPPVAYVAYRIARYQKVRVANDNNKDAAAPGQKSGQNPGQDIVPPKKNGGKGPSPT